MLSYVSVADASFRTAASEDQLRAASKTGVAPKTELTDDKMTSSKATLLEDVDQQQASTTEAAPEPEMEDDKVKSSNSKSDLSIQLENVQSQQRVIRREPHSEEHEW